MVLYSAGIFHPCKRYKTKNGQETGEFVFRNQVYCLVLNDAFSDEDLCVLYHWYCKSFQPDSV